MGENLFNAASVFSYFSPQYRTENGLLGPEFQIYSTQTAADRADIVNSAALRHARHRHKGQSDAVRQRTRATLPTCSNYISSVFLHGACRRLSQQAATSAANAATTPTAKAQAALYVVLTSGEYQIIQ